MPLDKPPPKVPQRKSTAVLGTKTHRLMQLEAKRLATKDDFELNARKLWRDRNARGEGSVHQTCQMIGRQKLDNSFLKKRVEVLISFDTEQDGGTKKKVLHWCGGVVDRICDGTWLGMVHGLNVTRQMRQLIFFGMLYPILTWRRVRVTKNY